MKRTAKLAFWTAVILAAGAAFWLWQRRDASLAAEPSVALAEVERRDVEVEAEAAGLIEPVRVVEVKSNASGEVLAVDAETGDRVARGTLLAEIDPRDVQSTLDQAAADLESARVRLSTAEAEHRRNQRLHAEGLVAEQDVERTAETVAEARSSLVRTETAVRLAREKRQDVTIRAPIDGTVIERGVEPGQIIASATSNVSGGTTLFKMADLSQMQVRANVDEVDIGKVGPGQPAEVAVEAFPGRVFAGEVVKIEPQAVVDQNVTMFPVLVRLDNSEGLLRPGMNAEVTMSVARRPDAVAIPNAAVVSPREARAAAELLGVDPEALRGVAGGPGGRGGWREGGRDGAAAAAGGGAPATDGVEPSAPAATPAAATAGTAAGRAAAGARSALVFVQRPGGPEPRRVLLGLSDWEYTEVLDGLQPGETVVLVSVAQLQQRQQEMTQRVRERFGGPLGTGGGGSGRGGGGGGSGRGGSGGGSGGSSSSGRGGGGGGR